MYYRAWCIAGSHMWWLNLLFLLLRVNLGSLWLPWSPDPFSSQPDFFFKRTLGEAAKPAEVGNGAPAWCLALMGGPARWVFSRVFLLPLWK